MKTTELRTTRFLVQIPNLDGDGIAETVAVDVQCFTDPETGEDVLTSDSIELIDRTKARRMGLILPDELKSLRERLDLSQDEISDLLQIGAKTYTRWESGRARPSRSLNVMLCALRDGVITVEYLRALRTGGGVTSRFAERISARDWTMGVDCWSWVAALGSDPETRMKTVIHSASAGIALFARPMGQRLAQPNPKVVKLVDRDGGHTMIPDRLFGSSPRHQWVQETSEE
jgi:DNA-binding transcriptional regulator YiaG